MTEWNYLLPEVRGDSREELPYVQSHRRRLRVPGCSSTGVAERSYPMPEVREEAKRSYPRSKGRRGDLLQGKEQLLRFAGAAVKKYPMSKVREILVRW